MDLAQTLVGARESLTRYAMSLCRRRADAEDLVQTAFLRAQGMSGADIAQALGVPAATVRTRLRAARMYLQKHLEAQSQKG